MTWRALCGRPGLHGAGVEVGGAAHVEEPHARGSHSSMFQLNVSPFCEKGGAVGVVYVLFDGGCQGVSGGIRGH